MPLGNWVILETGKPERMHFTAGRIESRTVSERGTGKPILRRMLVLDVDALNGTPVNAQFSTMAEGLYAKLEPYLVGEQYRGYDFTITATGEDFMRRYSVLVTPRP